MHVGRCADPTGALGRSLGGAGTVRHGRPAASDSNWIEPTDVLGAPNLASEPDAALAPKGVDTRPLRSPPELQPAADRSRPFDPADGIMNLDHLVFIVLENRSFDHYFGTFPGADGIPMDANDRPKVCLPDPEQGGCHRPYHDSNFIDQGGPHGEVGSEISINGGAMDGFVEARRVIGNGCDKHPDEKPCPQAVDGPQGQPDVMGYHTAKELPIYWEYAKTFTLHDRMFAPTDSWTLPAHLFLISAWSATCNDLDDPMSCSSDQKFPGGIYADEPSKIWAPKMGEPRPYVWAPITWLLYKAGVSWGYYVGEGTCVAPPCEHLEGILSAPVQNPLPGFTAAAATGQLDNIQAEHGVHPRRAQRRPAERLVVHARAGQGRAPARLDRGRAGLRGQGDQRGHGGSRGTVDAHRDLPHLGRLGRVLRPRAATGRRRERMGAARALDGDQPVGEARLHRLPDAQLRRLPEADRGPLPGRTAPGPRVRRVAGLAPHGARGGGTASATWLGTSTSPRSPCPRSCSIPGRSATEPAREAIALRCSAEDPGQATIARWLDRAFPVALEPRRRADPGRRGGGRA